MKTKKTLLLGLSAFAVFSLASCKSNKNGNELVEEVAETALREGYTDLANQYSNAKLTSDGKYTYAGLTFNTKNTYKQSYSTEPDNLNYLTNGSQWNSEWYANMVDGLVENDKYGNIVGALARGYKSVVNADGTQTWTFQLKEGVHWVDNKTGEKYSEVVAQNFVDGLKYVLDPANASATVGIVCGQINGAEAYYDSLSDDDKTNDLDFSTVGIKAVDQYTVEYTTPIAMPYFLTCLTYSPYLPVDGNYLNSKGSQFGKKFDDLLVNGAFRTTKYVIGNYIQFEKNKSYYDKDHVYVDKVVSKYLDSEIADYTTARLWFENGVIDSFGVNSNDAEGWKNYVVGGEGGTGTLQNPASDICNSVIGKGSSTYVGYFNFNRSTFDYTIAADAKTEAQKAATKKALANKNFRLGILYGVDVTKYLESYSGKINYLTRIYTSPNLCSADGKDYTEFVQEIFNEKNGTDVSLFGIEAQQDIVYNTEKSKAYFATAKTELLAAGLTESDFPIRIDAIGELNATYSAYTTAMYDALRENGKGVCTVYENVPTDSNTNMVWSWSTCNYDLQFGNGWGPDYADPQTFLHTFALGGELLDYIGLGGKNNAAYAEEILGDYDAKYQKAAAIVDGDKLAERYKAFAEAEYSLIYEEGIVIPFLQANGYSAVVSRTVAHQAGSAGYGLTGDKLKNVVVTTEAITKEQRTTIDNFYKNKEVA